MIGREFLQYGNRAAPGSTASAGRASFWHGIAALVLVAGSAGAASSASTHLPDRTTYTAPFAVEAPRVDGVGEDAVWARAPWHALEHRWLGPDYAPEDFQGRFKVVWNRDALFLLVEVVDDVLIDRHADPLVRYWDDDCLEIFLDADHSGGDHQYTHNAFAYHMSLDNRAIDIGTDRRPRDYSHHVTSRWRRGAEGLTWELAIRVFADDYVDDSPTNVPLVLERERVLGLMLAWCDNDGSELRENFVGSESVPSGAPDRGWIDAGLFGTLVLGR